MKRSYLSSLTALFIALALMLMTGAAFIGLASPVFAESDPAAVSDDANDSDVAAAPDGEGEPADKSGEGDTADGELATTGESASSDEHEETPEEKAERKAREKKERISKGLVYALIGAAVSVGIIVAVTVPGWKKSGAKINTTMLTESALMIAIGTVCSLIKIDLPFGGGVTIVSMLPLIMISHRHSWRWGLLTAFVYSLIQLIFGLDNVGYAANIPMAFGIVFFDYILAYTVIGLSGIFGRKRAGIAIGIAVSFGLRFLCHYLTGVWIWNEWMPETFFGLTMTTPWIYSALYNGWYMLAELVITMVVAMLIYKPLEKFSLPPVKDAAAEK